MPVIVALSRFGSDTEREFEMIRKHMGERGVEALVCEHFAKGSKGATNPSGKRFLMIRVSDSPAVGTAPVRPRIDVVSTGLRS